MRTTKTICRIFPVMAMFALVALASVPAQACQLVCMKTVAVYDGNLGGNSGADAKCAAEFPGFKYPRSASLVAAFSQNASAAGYNYWYNSGYRINVPNAAGNSSADSYAWIGSGRDTQAYSGAIQDCSGWNSSSAAVDGSRLANLSGNVYYGGIGGRCSTQLPLMCCNM